MQFSCRLQSRLCLLSDDATGVRWALQQSMVQSLMMGNAARREKSLVVSVGTNALADRAMRGYCSTGLQA